MGMAIELVQLRERWGKGEDDDMAETSARLTDLEEVFEDEEEKSDGLTGDAWIDEKLAALEQEMQPEIKEYDFGGHGNNDQDRS